LGVTIVPVIGRVVTKCASRACFQLDCQLHRLTLGNLCFNFLSVKSTQLEMFDICNCSLCHTLLHCGVNREQFRLHVKN